MKEKNVLEQDTRAGLTARMLLSMASDHVAEEVLMERKHTLRAVRRASADSR